ncbi:hypothetical protein NUSPORA_00258 [Nucleospora cyclopteri]
MTVINLDEGIKTSQNDKDDGVELCWKNINVSSTDGKHILIDLSGNIVPGTFLALIGPSGAGKSTFLNLLAGRTDSNLVERGEVLVNGELRNSSTWTQIMSYVVQKFVFYSNLTVYESLLFAAHAKNIPKHEINEKIQLLLDRIQMPHHKNTLLRNLSGGELVRVKTAIQLINDPKILFLDEPTSGLDSYRAYQLCEFLGGLTKTGMSIIITIHQPSSHLIKLFDQIYLLSMGNCLFQGTIDNCISLLESLNYSLPPETCPTDHILDSVAIDFSDPVKNYEGKVKIQKIKTAYNKTKQPLTHYKSSIDIKPISRPIMLWILIIRNLKNTIRKKSYFNFYIIQKVTLALIVVFVTIPVKNYNGVFYFDAIRSIVMFYIIIAFLTVIGYAFNSFHDDNPIIDVERKAGLYTGVEAFLAKFVAEFVITGFFENLYFLITMTYLGWARLNCRFLTVLASFNYLIAFALSLGMLISTITNTADAAQTVGAIFSNVFMVFGGFFFNADYNLDYKREYELGYDWKNIIVTYPEKDVDKGKALPELINNFFYLNPLFYVFNYIVFAISSYNYLKSISIYDKFFDIKQAVHVIPFSRVSMAVLLIILTILCSGSIILHFKTGIKLKKY